MCVLACVRARACVRVCVRLCVCVCARTQFILAIFGEVAIAYNELAKGA